ncbi:MAG: YaiO family outer membrane beta-barrel protein [Sulfuricaulis sp.]|nr:YaiO family outer membrane beta-barrel protein [Sulfuricaulis sp.]
MTHLRHWLIVAALLSTTHTSGLGAEPLEGIHAAGGRLGLKDALLASHAVQPFKHMELGLGLSTDAIATDWYGVHLNSLDRIAERNTLYGLPRESPRFGPSDSKTPPALCCQNSGTVASLEQYANVITAREVSPTFFVFGLLRKKGYDINLKDGWKLQAGVRHMQYGITPQTRTAFFTVERHWENFRTSYSYQLERVDGSFSPGHVLQLDYLYSPRDSIGVSFASGREFAYFGPLNIQNTEVRNVAVRGQHWFKQDWALTFQAGYSDHGSLAAQTGVRVGIRHSF